MTTNKGWDEFSIRYEQVQEIDPATFKDFLLAAELKNGHRIGDLMAGYGAVSREIAKEYAHLTDVRVVVAEKYATQVARAKEELHTLIDTGLARIVQGDIQALPLIDRSLDRALVKMGFHELPAQNQLTAAKEAYRILRKGGLIAVWDLLPQTPQEQAVIQEHIRFKDTIAGYSAMAEQRYFARKDEIISNLRQAGFTFITTVPLVPFSHETKNRLNSDFKGDQAKLDAWNEHIRKCTPEDMKYLTPSDSGESIRVSYQQGVVVGHKMNS